MISRFGSRRANSSLSVAQKLRAMEARAEQPPPEPEGPDNLDRARGVMLGLAVGDALGSTLEFGPRVERFADFHRDMIGGGPFGLQPGQWTDDTAIAFAWRKAWSCETASTLTTS